MGEKITKIQNKPVTVDDLFNEVASEVNQEVINKAKVKIRELMRQKTSAEKLLANIDRQLEELKLEISQELK